MDYKKLYTPTEANALYNIAKIKYDPTSYSLKGNLITTGSERTAKDEHIANFNYKSEINLIDLIQDNEHRSLKYLTGVSGKTASMGVTESDMAYVFVQQDNLHVCLDILQHIVDLDTIKSTNIMQTLITICIALNSQKSCSKEMFAMFTGGLNVLPYSDICTFEFLRTSLKSGEDLYVLDRSHCVDVTYVPSVSEISPIKTSEDFVGIDSLFANYISAFEVMWAYRTLPEDFQNCFLAMCTINNSTDEYDFKFFEPFIKWTSAGFELDASLENAIAEPNPEKRYTLYQDILSTQLVKIQDHCKDYYNVDLSAGHCINPMIAMFTTFVMQLGLINFRVNYIRMLYEYCTAHKYFKPEDISDISSKMYEKFEELSGMLASAKASKDEKSKDKSLMDLDKHKHGGKPSKDIKDTDHTSPALFEALDKAKSKFEDSIYRFETEDVINTSDEYKTKYNAIASKVSLVNKLLIRKIKDIKTYNVGGKNPGKPSGRLDRKTIYRYKYDPNIFYDNTYKTLESDLAFGIVLDESGSMCGKGIENGRITMIVLHETLKALGINHSIVGHTSYGNHHCVITRYQSFREDKTYTTCKNYALVKAEAKSGNCDSGALYYMEKALSRVKNKDKICLIFSDGAPTECTGTELKNQVKNMERKGIKVIGIGINFESIAKYYTDYANGRNLTDMLNIVAKILEEYVLKKKDK